MKRLVLFILMFMATATVCFAEDYQLSGETSGYKVVMSFAQTLPREGKNAVEIAVTDPNSQPVKNARVEIKYLMPSLPGKSPMMESTATAKSNDDAYSATLDLSMKGEWKVAVTVVKGKKKGTVALPTFFVK